MPSRFLSEAPPDASPVEQSIAGTLVEPSVAWSSALEGTENEMCDVCGCRIVTVRGWDGTPSERCSPTTAQEAAAGFSEGTQRPRGHPAALKSLRGRDRLRLSGLRAESWLENLPAFDGSPLRDSSICRIRTGTVFGSP